jgi:hypothetical protein
LKTGPVGVEGALEVDDCTPLYWYEELPSLFSVIEWRPPVFGSVKGERVSVGTSVALRALAR